MWFINQMKDKFEQAELGEVGFFIMFTAMGILVVYGVLFKL